MTEIPLIFLGGPAHGMKTGVTEGENQVEIKIPKPFEDVDGTLVETTIYHRREIFITDNMYGAADEYEPTGTKELSQEFMVWEGATAGSARAMAGEWLVAPRDGQRALLGS